MRPLRDEHFASASQLVVDALFESGTGANRAILDHADALAQELALHLLRVVARAGFDAMVRNGVDPSVEVAGLIAKAEAIWTGSEGLPR